MTTPSIADIRLAATLEFLRAIDYDLPGLGRVVPRSAWRRRSASAYTEPAADVRGYVASVKEPTAA